MGSRVKNSIRNSFWGAMTNVIMTILNFVVRTVFIKTLGNEYLGINGLFTNILYILSFAELGVGHAITYCMYKPVAQGDQEKIKSLLKLYKRFYNMIGMIIFGMGLMIIPFFPYVIKEVPDIQESLVLIYLLYLFETASSYFFSYKKSIITVNQNDYLCDIVKLILSIIKAILQVIVLVVFNNYLLYLGIYILSTFLTNVILSRIASKKYPYIQSKDVKDLDVDEKNRIISNIKSLILYKVGRVSLSGTDNIIISSLLGLQAVGIYSNYSLIISAVSGFTYILLKGTISSVGNINATESNDKKEQIMKQLLFISNWLYGFITICLAVLLNPFIELWLGKEYLLAIPVVIVAVLYILIDGVEFASHTYISTMGYFKQTRYSSLMAAILNIVLSIILGEAWGYFGIFMATSIAKLLTSSWYDTYVIYKYEFKKSPKSYYLMHIVLLLCSVLNFIICYVVNNLIIGNTIMLFIVRCLVVIILSNLVFILLFWKTSDFKMIWRKFFKEKIIWRRKSYR